MPQPQQDARREERAVVRLRGDRLVQQREEAGGVVLGFDIDVEFNVLVLGL